MTTWPRLQAVAGHQAIVLPLMLALTLSACGPRADLEAERAAIRAAESRWVQAVAEKDVETIVGFYTDDGAMYPPNAPLVQGREALRNEWTRSFTDPNFALTWKADKIEMARSGDLAGASGSYEFTSSGPDGRAVTERGKYVVVWRKESDGRWKAIADIWNPDAPAAPQP